MSLSATQRQVALTQAAKSAATQSRLPVGLTAVLLVVLTLALYWPATSCDFVHFDDPSYVTGNQHVQGGLTWEGIKWACSNPVSYNWHPMTVWSHMLACQVFGLKPWGHHLINILLHAINAGLVFTLMRQMTGSLWRSLLVAALFAAHPLRVESVVWVSERKDVLSGFFGLLALMLYVHYTQTDPPHASRFTFDAPRSTLHASTSYLLSLFLFALGLMSKPMLVTLPFVMLLLDYWPLCRIDFSSALRLLKEKVPFFVLAGMGSVVTFVVQQRTGSLAEGEKLELSARAGNALISYCRYLGKLFWPTDLAAFYPHPGHWPMGTVLAAAGLMLGVSILLFALRRRAPALLMGWLWFCGTLVPVIGLVQTGAQAMADRHTYLPSLGILLLVIWGGFELTRGWRYQVWALSLAGGAATLLCLAVTRQQIGYWRNTETLFRHALEATKQNEFAHYGLGVALGEAGQSDEAIRQLQDAIRLTPRYYEPRYNLAVVLSKQGRFDEAIREYQEAIRLEPNHPDAFDGLGVALSRKGQLDEAISQYQAALQLNPNHADARNNLGAALSGKGQLDQAILQFQEGIRQNPGHADTHYNLGIALSKKGQSDEAIRQFQEVIRLKPDHAEAHINLGAALGKKGQLGEAIRHLQEAVRLRPDHAVAHNNLGVALGRNGQAGDAIRQFQEALRLKPDYPDARKNLSAVLEATPGASTNR